MTRRPKQSAKEPGIWQSASDIWITSATKMLLLTDSRTPALDINVETRAGVVTLFGIVHSQEAKAAAAEDARKVSGVKRVVNDLQVMTRAKEAAVKVRDEDIESDVKKAFEKADFKDISVRGEERRRAANRDGLHRDAAPRRGSASALDSGRARGQGRTAAPTPRANRGAACLHERWAMLEG